MEATHSFGYWLRRRRKALDLTQAELAERVACVVVTIKKIEQDARRPSRLLAERLADALALAPAEREPFLLAARAELAPSRLPAPADRPLADVAQPLTASTPAAIEQILVPAPPTRVWLFTDLASSTRLWQDYPATMGAALAHHDALLRNAVQRAGGQVFKTVGDAVYAVFPASRPALEATLAAQRALRAADWSAFGLPADAVHVRMALHAGSAEEREGDFFGPALNHLARLLGVGHGGQILLSAALAALAAEQLPPGAILRDLGRHQLKDLPAPEQIAQLVVADLPDAFPPLRAAAALVGNLPALTVTLLGRGEAVAALGERLRAGARLLTITGPGGAGKTTLALAAATTLRAAFPDGIWFADLTPMRQVDQVGPALAQALGLPTHGDPIAAVREAFGAKRALLVIDNFEQVAATAPLVGDLLTVAPRLAVLVTSRVPLRLRAEQEYPLPPLALPPPGALLADVERSPAVQLFVARAQATQPAFTLTAANAPVVAELCRRLDGLPLALELAAARVRLLPPEALLKRLSLALLRGGPADAPERHQTLHATVAWSEQLLRPGERRLFARLGLLVGGASLDAVDALGDTSTGDPLEALEGLVAHNLVLAQAGPDGEPRYTMLETIRAYALERLAADGDEEQARRQVLAFVTAYVEASLPGLNGSAHEQARQRLIAEWPNISATLEWASTAAPAGLIQLLNRIPRALHHLIDPTQARGWIEAALEIAGAELQTALRVRAHLVWVFFTNQSLQEAALARGKLAITEARTLGDERLLANALATTATTVTSREDALKLGSLDMLAEALLLARQSGDQELLADLLFDQGWLLGEVLRETDGSVVGPYEESLSIYRQIGNTNRVWQVMVNLGVSAYKEGDFNKALSWYGQCLPIVRRLGYNQWIALVLTNIVEALLNLGRAGEARSYLVEALLRLRDTPRLLNLHSTACESMASLLIAEGQCARAATLLGAADVLLDQLGLAREPIDATRYDRFCGEARAALGDEAFALAYASGKLLDHNAAIRAALGLTGVG